MDKLLWELVLWLGRGAIIIAVKSYSWFIKKPTVWLSVMAMENFAIRKKTLALSGFGITVAFVLLAQLQILGSVVTLFWILAAFSFLVSFSMLGIQEEEEFIEAAEDIKAQKRADREELKLSKNTSDWEANDNDYDSSLSQAEIARRIETVMSGSKLYPEEDYEKLPNFYLTDYYTINEIEEDGTVDVTFKTYTSSTMAKTTDDLRKNLASLLAASMEYEGTEEYLTPGQVQGSINLKLYPNMPENGEIDFVKDIFVHTDEIWEDTDHLKQGIPYGVNSVGQRCYYKPYENHALAGGSSGGGKSVWARNIVAGLAKSDAIIIGFDLKMGVELEPFADRLSALATTPDEALILLEVLVKVMNIRYGIARQRGLQGIAADSKEFPLIAVVMDEIAQLTDSDNFPTKALKEQYYYPIQSSLKKLYTLARAANMVLIAMTQSPKATIVDTNMRNNIASSYGLRTKDNTQLVTIIGGAGEKLPIIAPDEIGAGYGVGKGLGNDVVKFKTYFISTEKLNTLIKETVKNTPDLAKDPYKSWAMMTKFNDEVWNSRLVFWEETGMISEKAYSALVDAKTLTEIKNELNPKEVTFILNSVVDMLPDGKLLSKRFTFEDINEFAG